MSATPDQLFNRNSHQQPFRERGIGRHVERGSQLGGKGGLERGLSGWKLRATGQAEETIARGRFHGGRP